MGRRGESVEQSRAGQQQRSGAHRCGEGGARVHRLQPAADGLVVDEYAGPDAAGNHHDVGRADFVEGGVARDAEHAVLGSHLTALVPDEHDVYRRNALQDFVGPDCVQRGEPREQRDGDLHQPVPAGDAEFGLGLRRCRRRSADAATTPDAASSAASRAARRGRGRRSHPPGRRLCPASAPDPRPGR